MAHPGRERCVGAGGPWGNSSVQWAQRPSAEPHRALAAPPHSQSLQPRSRQFRQGIFHSYPAAWHRSPDLRRLLWGADFLLPRASPAVTLNPGQEAGGRAWEGLCPLQPRPAATNAGLEVQGGSPKAREDVAALGCVPWRVSPAVPTAVVASPGFSSAIHYGAVSGRGVRFCHLTFHG